jgi:hypothetical protein
MLTTNEPAPNPETRPHWLDEDDRAAQFVSPNARPGLEAMRADAEPGICPFCLDPLPLGRKGPKRHCGDAECERAYHRTSQRDRRRRKRAATHGPIVKVEGGYVDGSKYGLADL